jgi:hypothetical protein
MSYLATDEAIKFLSGIRARLTVRMDQLSDEELRATILEIEDKIECPRVNPATCYDMGVIEGMLFGAGRYKALVREVK